MENGIEVVSDDRKPRFIQPEIVSESEEVIVTETVDEVAEDITSKSMPKNVSLNLTLFESLVAIAQNVYEICEFNFKPSQIDFVELSGPAGQETLELLWT